MPLDPIRIGLAYVEARAEQCRQILAEAGKSLEPQPLWMEPKRPREPGEVCYRCPRLHVITEPDHQLTWPLTPTLSGLSAVPFDQWSPPNAEAFREFERQVDDFIAAESDFEFVEAAE